MTRSYFLEPSVLGSRTRRYCFLLPAPTHTADFTKVTPQGRGGPAEAEACTGSPWVVNPRTGQDFGRRPRQPADNPKEVWRKRGLQFLHPRPMQTPEGHACCQGPSLVTQDTPIGSQGPFQAGGQAPPIHRVTKSQQGEFKGIPSHRVGESPLLNPLLKVVIQDDLS